MKQSTRIEIAKSTLEILKQGFYVNNKGIKVSIEQLQQNAVASAKNPGQSI
jgi:hypothetical protein